MSEDGAATPNPGRDWFSPGRFAAILAVMVFIPFRDVLAGTQSFVARDYGLFSYPVASFLRDSYWRGEWPLWNPLSLCGTPFLAQFNTLALYPPSLIYVLLPLAWALPFFCLLHLYLGGLGMYFLAARWSGSRAGGAVAGTIFSFNGLTLNLLMWPSHIATYALMPWVIWLALDAWKTGGRRLVVAALAAAAEVLAGGPETILFTWLILFVLMVCQLQKWPQPRRLLIGRFFAMGGLAFCLAAAQLLPFIELSLNSNRSNGYANGAWSMPALGWANFLVPLFETSQWQQIVVQDNQYWTSSYYGGIGAVFLAVMALWHGRTRRVWLLGGMFLLSLVLALGDHGYLFPLLQQLLPFLGMFRYPVKFVLVSLFALPLLAAAGIAHYENWKPSSLRPWWREFACEGGILVLVGLILWIAHRSSANHVPWGQIAANGLTRVMFSLLVLISIYFFASRPGWRGWSGTCLVALMWLDVLTHMPWQNPTADPSVFQTGLALQSASFKGGPVGIGESRVMLSPYAARQLYYGWNTNVTSGYLQDRAAFLADCNLLDQVPKVDGFFSLYLRHIDKVLSLFDTNSEAGLGQLEDVMAVSQTIAPGRIFDWVSRASYVPWVSVGQEPVFADEEATLRAMAEPKYDFHKVLFLPLEAKGSVMAVRQEAARITEKEFGATKIVLDVDSPGTALVWISQAWYPNWKARVDGMSVTLWRANAAFQAVQVPAGRHEVGLVYEDWAFRWGLVVSVLGLLFCGVYWYRCKVGGAGNRL